MKLSSRAFSEQGEIPSLYTCQGKDVSPPLGWSGLPEGTKGLALIVDDPDAPDPAAPSARGCTGCSTPSRPPPPASRRR